jgi:FG-GAP repeat
VMAVLRTVLTMPKKRATVASLFLVFLQVCSWLELSPVRAAAALEVGRAQKISDTRGNFQGALDDNDLFGVSVCGLGDLDGDATQDLVVGAYQDDDGGTNRGAVYVLFLHPNGTVRAEQKISDAEGNFRQGALGDNDQFGASVAALGDLDGDTVGDLAVGARSDDDGGVSRGAVYVLFMHPNGTVKTDQKISDTEGNFQGVLTDGDLFGQSVAALGDLDGDATADIAVGAHGDDDGGNGSSSRGAVHVLFLFANGTVKANQKISDTQGGLQRTLDFSDYFGFASAALGDLDGDMWPDLAVGAHNDDDGGTNTGAVYVLFLNPDGTVKAEQKISDREGNFQGMLDDEDLFGVSLVALGDVNGDAITATLCMTSRSVPASTRMGGVCGERYTYCFSG